MFWKVEKKIDFLLIFYYGHLQMLYTEPPKRYIRFKRYKLDIRSILGTDDKLWKYVRFKRGLRP